MKKANLPDKSGKKNANLCRRMQDYKKKMPIYEKKQDKFIKKIYK